MSLALRRTIIRTARRMNALGINQGRSGNVSARWGAGFLITPTAVDYGRLGPAGIVAVEFDGRHRGKRTPSSEWRFHHDILKTRPETGAVVHAHAPYARIADPSWNGRHSRTGSSRRRGGFRSPWSCSGVSTMPAERPQGTRRRTSAACGVHSRTCACDTERAPDCSSGAPCRTTVRASMLRRPCLRSRASPCR